MKSLVNIEKSAFHEGEYIGYAQGIWIIRKTNSPEGNWLARHRDDNSMPLLYGLTLEEISKKLTNYSFAARML
jgi:hypothetical protein